MRRLQGGKHQIFRELERVTTRLNPLLVEYIFRHKETSMAEKVPQTHANHVRLHPPFHFFLLTAASVLLILTIVNVVRHSDLLESWILLLIGLMTPIAILLIRVN